MEQLTKRVAPESPPPVPRTLASGRERRVLILWAHVPHYLAACIRAVLAEHGAQVLLMVERADGQENHVPLQAFANFRYVDVSTRGGPSPDELVRIVENFAPELVVAGCPKWGILPRLAKAAKARGALVVWAADHYWRGTWRDYANTVCCRLGLIYRFYDAAWVPGSGGRQYARRLGFDEVRIFEGVYACDSERFRRIGLARFGSGSRPPWPHAFLFVGQYIERKNLATLLAAYARYRASAPEPWELWCAGHGPLQAQLQGRDGVRDYGPQDASGCADLMAQAGVFVLPSWVDHWGVVIHEAACAGLPILASRTCAATAHLVREGCNGFTFAPGDAGTLCRLLRLVADEERAVRLGRNSLRMSYQFDPNLWAETLLDRIPSCVRGPQQRIAVRPGVLP